MGLNIFSSNHTRDLALKVIDKINENRKELNYKTTYDGLLDELVDVSVVEEFAPIKLGNCKIEYFANKEITCEYQESIRDKPVYIFGHTGTHEIMELLLMLDAAKRASASKIYAVIPCYGYARQDKKEGKQKRGPIGAKLVADMIMAAAGKRFCGVIAIDLHSESIEGFFDDQVNHISGATIFKSELRKIITEDTVIASPDAGGKQRASRLAKKLGVEMVGMDKTRVKPGEVASISLVGDVERKDIVIVDDMVDSGGTLIKAADYLINEKGAKSVAAVCTHPILSGNAIEKINNSTCLSNLWISDTLPLSETVINCSKIKIISSADILAKIIGRVSLGQSMDAINN